VIPFVYIYVTTAVVGGNLIYGVGRFTIQQRIRFGYLLFVVALSMVPLVDMGLEVGNKCASAWRCVALLCWVFHTHVVVYAAPIALLYLARGQGWLALGWLVGFGFTHKVCILHHFRFLSDS
jgi:hypothetical protein